MILACAAAISMLTGGIVTSYAAAGSTAPNIIAATIEQAAEEVKEAMQEAEDELEKDVAAVEEAATETEADAEGVKEEAAEDAAQEEAPAEDTEEKAEADAAEEAEAPAEETEAEEAAPEETEAEEAAPEEAEEAVTEDAAAEEAAEEAETVEETEAAEAADGPVLKGLTVRDGTLKPIFDGFDPAKTEYAVTVQSDIYGVLIDPEVTLPAKVTVTADKDCFAFDGTENYKAGDKIPYDFDLDGYVVQLGQAYEDYDSEFVQTATITVAEAGKETEYKVVITREDDTEVYKLFEEKEYTDAAGTTIPYELYIPSDYDEDVEYPVVFALHGSGQRTQPLDMVLKRYQMATVWAKDSEAGHNQCIVLAPQCTVEDEATENWTTLMASMAGEAEDSFAPMPQLNAAYDLLLEVLQEYSCDEDRVYMTGLSAGGWATFTLAEMYPETFAAIAPDASAANPEGVAALKDIPMWIFQAGGDPSVPTDKWYYPTIEALDEAGVEYNRTFYKNGDVFFPNAHFSWVPMYANEEFRDWMFAQTREIESDDADAILTDLQVRDATQKEIFEFLEDEKEFSVDVQSDIYGVLVSPEAPKGAKITVTADKDANNYDGSEGYVAGTKIPYDKALGGYVVQLGQEYEDYDTEFEQIVTISVSAGNTTNDYTLTITRAEDSDTYELFEAKEFTDSEGTTIPYMLYVPTDYDDSKEYPIVFALHGSGQRTQPLDMVLKRYQMATVWAKDSEKGINECIVLAPQCAIEDPDTQNWCIKNEDGYYENSPELDAAYELLGEVMGEYSIDADRVYMTGLSAGGRATFQLATQHPDVFAAIAPDAAGANLKDISKLKGIPMWLFQAADDPTVDAKANYYEQIKIFDAEGIDYKSTVYGAGDVFFPNAHFSWVPMYANEEFRDWLFSQSKDPDEAAAMDDEKAKLTGLGVRDATQKEIFEGFVEGETEYAVNVQSDIYGVLVSPKSAGKITVTADTDCYAYDGTLNYKAGDEIEYDEELGGYVVQLGQAYEDYDSEFVQTVTINIKAGEVSNDYKIVITRADDTEAYKLFDEKEFTDSKGTKIPYELYIPSNYDEEKKYPVVFALHGSGQRTQPLDMVLKRYQMATVWAKDSEAGHNECIVLAPQCTVEDATMENWTTLMAYRNDDKIDNSFEPMPQLDAAYELLLQVLDEYSCDKDRVYMTGLSAGGWATFTLAEMYPETFAAIAPDASAADPEGIEALRGMPMWIFQAAGDPSVPTDQWYYPTIEALDAAGIEYNRTFYKAGAVFFPNAHFSWVPMYADEEFRDWLFEQHK